MIPEEKLLPVPPESRSIPIDVARGFALLGLIFANIWLMGSCDYLQEWWGTPPNKTLADTIGRFLLHTFVSGKCYAILSFLFGVGIAMQWNRARSSGAAFYSPMITRMLVLLLFGVFHGLLLWGGDALTSYALVGFGVLFLSRLPAKFVRLLAMVLIAGTTLWGLSVAEDFEQYDSAETGWIVESQEMANDYFRNGTYPEIVYYRLYEYLFFFVTFLPYIGLMLATCLLGYDSIRSGWFPSRERLGAAGYRWSIRLGVLGFILSAIGAYFTILVEKPEEHYIVRLLCQDLGAPLLAWFYLVLLLRLPTQWQSSQMLARIGRTPLTNYLLQSVVAGFLFYSYGFGQYGYISFAPLMVIAACIACLQIAFTNLWSKHFRFGPAEFLAHVLTYGRKSVSNRLRGV